MSATNKYDQFFRPSIIIPTKVSDLKPMKVIEMDKDKATSKAYLNRPPEDTHSKEEMDALLRSIAYTKMFKQQESYEKMEEEELITRPVPRL
jgi:hypothetical protein